MGVARRRGGTLTPLPTPETKNPSLASVYAFSKFNQERLALLIGRAYNIPAVALRFFNVYGTRQALSNPYTGVLAIFASRLLNGKPPLVNEDGQQRRDFVSVHDVTQACILALEKAPEVAGQAFNIGNGRNYSAEATIVPLDDESKTAPFVCRILGKPARAGFADDCSWSHRRKAILRTPISSPPARPFPSGVSCRTTTTSASAT
jgi:dTDP-L-rhamnose 4-epimerase